MTPNRLDGDLDRMLAAARPANPAGDAAVRRELDALIAHTIPDARAHRRRIGFSFGAGAGALLLAAAGAGAATAASGSSADELPVIEAVGIACYLVVDTGPVPADGEDGLSDPAGIPEDSTGTATATVTAESVEYRTLRVTFDSGDSISIDGDVDTVVVDAVECE